MRFEIVPLPVRAVAVDELVEVGLGRPAGEPADIDERLILAARLHSGLDVEIQGRDVARFRIGPNPDVGQFVEKFESYAAPSEHLVERREDDVAHAGRHLPEEGPAIGEERAHRATERRAGGEARGALVAVLVGKSRDRAIHA